MSSRGAGAAPISPHAGEPLLSRGRELAAARLAVIMLHGRGADASDIISIASAIDHPEAAYLAPNAAGRAWYPTGFMSPTAQNEPGITSAISVVHALLDQVAAAGIPPERTVLLGFSQGACLACTSAQRRPQRYGGVIVYSGGLIGPPGTVWDEAGDFAGTPVLFGCSDRDSHIPESRVRDSAAVLERMGADVTTRIYEGMGHTINDDEIEFTRDLLARLALPQSG